MSKDDSWLMSNYAKKIWALVNDDRLEKYEKTPKLCFFCKSSLSYEKRRNKFCTRSCAASFNNMGIVRNFKEDTYEEYIKERNNRNNYTKKECLHCKEITSNIRFCSRNCLSEYKKQQIS